MRTPVTGKGTVTEVENTGIMRGTAKVELVSPVEARGTISIMKREEIAKSIRRNVGIKMTAGEMTGNIRSEMRMSKSIEKEVWTMIAAEVEGMMKVIKENAILNSAFTVHSFLKKTLF
ncbi:hypothetical protein ACSBR2_012650 [Camellia fascicularis]